MLPEGTSEVALLELLRARLIIDVDAAREGRMTTRLTPGTGLQRAAEWLRAYGPQVIAGALANVLSMPASRYLQ